MPPTLLPNLFPVVSFASSSLLYVPPLTTTSDSSPQALYKLYNVAANHRHLYHHAFPGHQVEEVAEEQDKKRDWTDKTGRSRDFLVMDMGRREEEREAGHPHPPGTLVFWYWLVQPASTFTTLNLIMDGIMFMFRKCPSIFSVDDCFQTMDVTNRYLSSFVCEQTNTCTDTTTAYPASCQLFISSQAGFLIICHWQWFSKYSTDLWNPHLWRSFCSLKFSAVYKKQYLWSEMFESHNMYRMLNNEAFQASSAW